MGDPFLLPSLDDILLKGNVLNTYVIDPKDKTNLPLDKSKQQDKNSSSSQGGSHANFGLGSGPTSVKDMMLQWSQRCTQNYKGVKVENFSTSWNDGMAFCALIHNFYPDAFDFDSLDPKNRRENFALAFRMADEKAGVAPLLDVDDMVAMKKPDWKCVFTYVQSLYKTLS